MGLPRLSLEEPWLAAKRLICNQGIGIGFKFDLVNFVSAVGGYE